MAKNTFSSRDLQVLEILYSADEPLTATNIYNRSSDASLPQSTIRSVLLKLLQRNYIEEAGVTHSGKVLARTFRVTPNTLLQSYAEQCRLVVDIFGISPLITEILSLYDEDKKAAMMGELKELL